jgi:nicotinamide mononucleotide transporter
MSFAEITQAFVDGMKHTSWLEYIAVFAGIGSVWFSRVENILVYPIGLISTIIYVFLSFQYHLIGEAGVNIYYSVLSIYGWYLWAKKNEQQETILHITHSNKKDLLLQVTFFAILYITIYYSLIYLKTFFYPGVIPFGDAFASATAFTGMWLMAKKKVESWMWWILTNISSVPLYFTKGLVFTSFYYFVLLIMAFFGLMEWRKRASTKTLSSKAIKA